MMEIQEYEEKYADDVRHVCLAAGSGKFPDSVILDVFCNYYIQYEPENCFIAVEDGIARGYIICALDYDRFEEVFAKEILKKSGNPLTKMMGKGSLESLKKYREEYPAHLHIDLDPGIQGQGVGTKLMEALISHLKEKHVKGVMFGVDPKNENAIRFYEKMGFTVISSGRHEMNMGMKL